MLTILDKLVSKASDIYCHLDEGCYVSTCTLNCAIFNLKEHIEKHNHIMIFSYWLLLKKMSKTKNPVEGH